MANDHAIGIFQSTKEPLSEANRIARMLGVVSQVHPTDESSSSASVATMSYNVPSIFEPEAKGISTHCQSLRWYLEEALSKLKSDPSSLLDPNIVVQQEDPAISLQLTSQRSLLESFGRLSVGSNFSLFDLGVPPINPETMHPSNKSSGTDWGSVGGSIEGHIDHGCLEKSESTQREIEKLVILIEAEWPQEERMRALLEFSLESPTSGSVKGENSSRYGQYVRHEGWGKALKRGDESVEAIRQAEQATLVAAVVHAAYEKIEGKKQMKSAYREVPVAESLSTELRKVRQELKKSMIPKDFVFRVAELWCHTVQNHALYPEIVKWAAADDVSWKPPKWFQERLEDVSPDAFDN